MHDAVNPLTRCKVWSVSASRPWPVRSELWPVSAVRGGMQTTELNSASFQSFGVAWANSGESQASAWNIMSRKMSRFLTRFSSIVSNGATVKTILPQKRIFAGIRLVSTSTGRDFILDLYCVYEVPQNIISIVMILFYTIKNVCNSISFSSKSVQSAVLRTHAWPNTVLAFEKGLQK